MSSTTEARATASITITAGAEFHVVFHSDYIALYSGGGSIIVEDVDATSELVDQLLLAIASRRHTSANAKRCERRGAVGEAV